MANRKSSPNPSGARNRAYPKESQNPPMEKGMRPADQPEGKVRVPDEASDVDEMTTDQRTARRSNRKEQAPPKKG